MSNSFSDSLQILKLDNKTLECFTAFEIFKCATPLGIVPLMSTNCNLYRGEQSQCVKVSGRSRLRESTYTVPSGTGKSSTPSAIYLMRVYS
ncbi:hypothetical protein CYY_010213 [Polysphondylium violaceum]|uniref:Uncharacterized protein n=1 Tax=Polysphondylium violaceum TaxID=133409 RepID=A0A8J4UZY1_9MYCE|nr:hypothetical protein CYY_010213 [Polysphondylium violaceum]